ncbi:hypothetical protein BaRGS_00033366, partial [Batillaria attramentaria]
NVTVSRHIKVIGDKEWVSVSGDLVAKNVLRSPVHEGVRKAKPAFITVSRPHSMDEDSKTASYAGRRQLIPVGRLGLPLICNEPDTPPLRGAENGASPTNLRHSDVTARAVSGRGVRLSDEWLALRVHLVDTD